MRSCPHCGADNSTRRQTCYQCQNPLRPEAGPEPERPSPASRWEAIERVGQTSGRRSGRLAADASSVSQPRAPAAPVRAPRRYVPARRSSLGHVRRMGVFFQDLHSLTGSGIAIAPACREVERRAPRQLRAVARDMAQAAESGEPISAVMESHRTLFYPWHIGVVRAAEAGGFLPEAFEQIAHAYEVEWETRAALRLRVFVYTVLGVPAILVSAPLLLTVAQPIPEDGWTPSLVIETLMGYLRTVSLPIALGLAGLILLWQVLSATAWLQDLQRRIVLRLPVAGRVARATALDRYLATLGLMLRGGLPIASAAEEAALAAGNPVLTPKLLEFVPALREGAPLSSLLAQSRVFDADTLNMAATGETTGSLPDMLARAAGYYREDSATKRMMLVRAGGILIGVLYLCVFGALTYLGMRIYFDFAFRVEAWMTGEDLGGVNW